MFVSIPVVSFPTWIASKILAPESATYRRAIIANVLHVLAAIGLLIVAAFLQGLAGADSARALLVVLGMILLSVSIHIMIPAKVYEIGAWNAIGLNIVSSFITLAIGAAIFAGAVGVVGFANVTAPLALLPRTIQQVQKTANLPDLPSISSIPLFSSAPPTPAPPPPPTDYTVEIDSLLKHRAPPGRRTPFADRARKHGAIAPAKDPGAAEYAAAGRRARGPGLSKPVPSLPAAPRFGEGGTQGAPR